MNRLEKSCGWLLALAMVFTGAVFVASQWQFYWLLHPHLPVRDTWRLLPLVEQALQFGLGSIPLSEWWQTHSGAHRIAITRLLMVLNYSLLDGRNHLLHSSIVASTLALILIYYRVARQLTGTRSLSLRCLLFAMALCFLFSPSLSWMLANPVNASWYTMMAGSAAALALLVSGDRGPGLWQLLLALACALLAASSNFAGSLVWLLLPVALFMRRSRWAKWAVLLGLGFFWLYFPDLSSSSTAFPALWPLLQDTASYLGTPLVRDWPGSTRALVASSVIVLSVSWLIQLQNVFRQPTDAAGAALLPLLMASLCLGIALATQLGRVVFTQPDALRYQLVVMCYWLNICLLLAFHVRSEKNVSPAVFTLVLVLLVLPLQQAVPKSVRLFTAALATEHEARTGTPARKTYAPLLPLYSGDFFARHQDFLYQRGVAVYADSARSPCALTLLEQLPAQARSWQLQWELLQGPCSGRQK